MKQDNTKLSWCNNLSEGHILGPARIINKPNLHFHLTAEHRIYSRGSRTQAELGRLHLLAHAVQAHPELRDLLNLPEGWGRP